MNNIYTLVLITALLINVSYSKIYELDLRNKVMQERVKAEAIQLIVNDTLRIVIDENPTTGY